MPHRTLETLPGDLLDSCIALKCHFVIPLCPGFSWDGVNFLHTRWYGAVLWI